MPPSCGDCVAQHPARRQSPAQGDRIEGESHTNVPGSGGTNKRLKGESQCLRGHLPRGGEASFPRALESTLPRQHDQIRVRGWHSAHNRLTDNPSPSPHVRFRGSRLEAFPSPHPPSGISKMGRRVGLDGTCNRSPHRLTWLIWVQRQGAGGRNLPQATPQRLGMPCEPR